MKITVLGLGLMGVPMAERLIADGADVTVWNRTPSAAAPFEGRATIAGSVGEAVAGADLVLSMLLDGPVTREVLGQAIPLTPKGALVVNMASCEPEVDRALATLGRAYVDAPVSGGTVGAEAGTLTIFAGGAAENVDRAATALATLGRWTPMGPVGAGQVAKLANQLIVGVTIGAVAEALSLARAQGVDPATLRSALAGGFADSRILELHGQRMVEGDFAPRGRASVQLKDMRNVVATAGAQALPLTRCATEAYREMVEEAGLGDLDHSGYFAWLLSQAQGE